MKYDAIVVASGKGERANLGYNKVLYKLKNGRTILEEACQIFINDDDCMNIIVVTEENVIIDSNKVKFIKGGVVRQESVINGLSLATSEFVLIHDAARPFLSKRDLENVKKEVAENDAALIVTKATDTIHYSTNTFIEKTIDRNCIYQAQTPQAFKTSLIKEAYKNLKGSVTDDASVVENYGHKVKLVVALDPNKKLTNKEDFLDI